MNILVTGGAGFIGAHLVKRLVGEGHNVTILDNLVGGDSILNGFLFDVLSDINFIKGDVCNKKTCSKVTKEQDIVYHLACHAAEGQSVFIPHFNAETNILGSINILASAINNEVEKFVFTSSVAVYGRPKELPVSEECVPDPEDPYGISKFAFEKYLKIYYELGQITPYIIRFFNVYGPWQRMEDPYRGVIPIFINKAMKNEPPIIFGDGGQTRAFTYITDIIEPLVNIVSYKRLVNTPINIGAEEPYSVEEVAKMILEKMRKKTLGLDYVEKRDSDVRDIYCDVNKAKRLMHYKAKVGLDEGLDKTIRWAVKQGPQKFKYNNLCEIKGLEHRVYKEARI